MMRNPLARTVPGTGVIFLGATAALFVSVIAWASIPDASGIIHGCYQKNSGQMRIVDTDAGQACNSSETHVQWNQTGPQGPAGPTGPQGPEGPAGVSIAASLVVDSASADTGAGCTSSTYQDAFTESEEITLPPGTYLPLADATVDTRATNEAITSDEEASILIIDPDNPVDFVISIMSVSASQGKQFVPPALGSRRTVTAFNLFTLTAPATIHAAASVNVLGCGIASVGPHRGSASLEKVTVSLIKLG